MRSNALMINMAFRCLFCECHQTVEPLRSLNMTASDPIWIACFTAPRTTSLGNSIRKSLSINRSRVLTISVNHSLRSTTTRRFRPLRLSRTSIWPLVSVVMFATRHPDGVKITVVSSGCSTSLTSNLNSSAVPNTRIRYLPSAMVMGIFVKEPFPLVVSSTSQTICAVCMGLAMQ